MDNYGYERSEPPGMLPAVGPIRWDESAPDEVDNANEIDQDFQLGASFLTLTQNNTIEVIQPIFKAIQAGDVKSLSQIVAVDVKVLNSSRCMGLAPIHAAVQTQNIGILRELLNNKVLISTTDLFGYTALHIAARKGWHEGINELLEFGASPGKMMELSSTVKQIVGESPLHIAGRRGDLQAVALMLRKEPDITVCDTRQCNLLHLAASSHSLPIITRLLQEKQCQQMLLDKNWKGNSVLHSALGLKSVKEVKESKVFDTVKSLIDAGADINAINNNGETPLYRAALAHLPNIVGLLLRLNADPTTLTTSNHSVLHAACSAGSCESLVHMLRTGTVSDYISHIDNDGNEPFHLAVKSCSSSCCEALLQNGDHLTKKDHQGNTRISLILKCLPTATQLISDIFDKHISISKISRHDPDFQVTFDYSPILSPNTNTLQCSVISELSSSKLEVFFKHPLVESFLRKKWNCICMIFYLYVALCFLFLIIHTSFVLLTYGSPLKQNNSEQHLGQIQNSSNLNITLDVVSTELICVDSIWCTYTTTLACLRAVYIVLGIVIIVPELLMAMTNVKKYMQFWENYFKIVAYSTSMYVVFTQNLSSPSAILTIERPVAAVSALFSWAVFMMQLGRFPAFGVYILMFTHVAKSMVKMLLAFSSLIIGFAVSFQVLYRDQPWFGNFFYSFTKTLMMMIGEMNYIEITRSETRDTNNAINILGSIFLVLFLFYVTVLMTNLLIGVAVHDVPVLQRESHISHLSLRASFLVAYEKTWLYFQNISFFPKSVLNLFARPCYINPMKKVFPNKYPKNKRLTILSETIEEAIDICSHQGNEDNIFIDNEDEDPLKSFKAFQFLYFRDKKALNNNIKQMVNESKQYSSILEQMQLLHKKIDQQDYLISNLIASQRNNN
ncbi:unnamed protein product [Meganyctiphanes norvegica]|uniref:Ion transport domain-containing protein n=1 Tax=Meganyctiphanes norvegica TaxID=48144 RepID=A0AAV2RYX2_MEGNR